jgi:hyperpolarization activated cyclic nucleotide-gated potassium channel 2
MKFINLIAVLSLITHWNACLQFLVPSFADFPSSSWVAIHHLQVSIYMVVLVSHHTTSYHTITLNHHQPPSSTTILSHHHQPPYSTIILNHHQSPSSSTIIINHHTLMTMQTFSYFQNEAWSTKYIWSCFKALSHMLCIGYGRFPPQNIQEVVVTCFSMVTGATCYGIFIAYCIATIQQTDSSRRQYYERVGNL